jgi:uncharacterized protein
MTHSNRTPAEVFRHGLQLLVDNDFAGWLALSADDVVFEFPYAPEGAPKRLEGRAALADYMSSYPDHIDLHDFPDVTVHQTDDPATIIVEMRAVGREVATGAPFESTYINVVTVADGRITHCRDYWNPMIMPESMRPDSMRR